MIKKTIFTKIIGYILLLAFCIQLKAQTTPPKSFFGFQPGEDRMLFGYDKLIEYLQLIDDQSDKILLKEIGNSPLGKPICIAFISAADNLNNLEKLKSINRELALNPDINNDQRESYIAEGKVFVLATLSMHSNEVGPSQSAPLMAYNLINATGSDTLEWLKNTVFMMVPCHNPDGMDMVVNHYNKYKDTKYEGSSHPGIYHKYVGHDNNRDFVTLTQTDTRAIAAIYNKNWYPQVMVEKHQMYTNGVRYFVPPMHDPIAVNIDEEVWNWTWVFGSNMAKDMTKQGLPGVSQHYLFDDYWPGSTETCLWKGVIGLLTEAASTKHAKPVYIEPNEIRVIGKGLAEHKKSINLTLPWEGGWWRLSNIVEYELSSMYSMLKTASMNREELLTFRNNLCKKEVHKGRTTPPYYYHLPAKQHDKSELVGLLELLNEHGVNVYKSNNDRILQNSILTNGDYIIPLAQPFRAFIKEVMENQEFPLRHYTPNGEIIKPYDITSWSLPLHRGVVANGIEVYSEELNSQLEKVSFPIENEIVIPSECLAYILTVNENASFNAIFQAMNQGIKVSRITSDKSYSEGSFILFNDPKKKKSINTIISGLPFQPVAINTLDNVEFSNIEMPNIGLVESYFHDMDAGWTRFVLDKYHIKYNVIRPVELKQPDALKNINVLIFPDMSKDLLVDGKMKDLGRSRYFYSYPPDYTKGMGKEGLNNILKYIDNGGKIISWRRSVDLFTGLLSIKNNENDIEEFNLPFNNIAENLKKQKFYCPGSLLQVNLKTNHPLTYGMPSKIGVFSRSEPILATSVPLFDMDRRVIGTFPEKNILLSGYIEKENLIAKKPAMVWIKKGKGQMILFSFYPQFRSSTSGTYKLLFNAILLN